MNRPPEKQGAEAMIAAYPDRVVVQVRKLPNDLGGSAFLTLFEVAPSGTIEVSRKGDSDGLRDLDIPHPGTFYAEVTDAWGKKHRTQTVQVDQGFFDLARQRAEDDRKFLVLKAKRDADAQRAQAQAAAAAAQAARGKQAEKNDLMIGAAIFGIIVLAVGVVLLLHYLTR